MNIEWIPITERLPETDDYILLSFENFSLPEIGRYEENESGGHSIQEMMIEVI